MKSKTLLSCAVLALLQSPTSALTVQQNLNQRGIFSKMIEMAQSDDVIAKERHEATLRKQKQLEEAEREHERLVA